MLYDLFCQSIRIAVLRFSLNLFTVDDQLVLTLSINLKHGNNNMATSRRVFLYPVK